MIPKIIHYCWFGGKPLPQDVKQCIRSWKKHCPDYEIRRWDEHNFDVTAHPFMKAAYEAKAWAFVSDYARLQVVYEHGGIYLDTDVELLKSLDPLLGDGCFLGEHQKTEQVATGLGFGAEAHHPAIEAMLKEYDRLSFDTEKKNELACPNLNTQALVPLGFVYANDVQRLSGFCVYPARYFDPFCPGEGQNLLCDDTISIHHYSASWTSWKQRLKRKLVRLIGQERILKLKEMLK